MSNPWRGMNRNKVLLQTQEGRDKLRAELAEANKWRSAIDDELVTIGSTAESWPDAKAALNAVIEWNVHVALDPRVSKAAQELINRGRFLETGPHYGPMEKT